MKRKINRLNPLQIAVLSLSFNLVYCLYSGYLGIANKSVWFITLCAYNTVLSVMRFGVLLIGKKENNKVFTMRFVGILFLCLSVTLIGITVISVTDNVAVVHHTIPMITIAAYSFIKVTLAIIALIKANKNGQFNIKILRNISLADAAVAIFSLQRSMLVSFKGITPENIDLFNILTGSGVCIIIFILGLNLIGGKRINMAKSKIVKTNKKIAEAVVSGYKKIENGVVSGYKKIEDGVVGGYTKIEDKFVEQYLTHDNETVEEAKARLKNSTND